MKATEDIFRAYDIRGVYGEELDAEIGERVGLACLLYTSPSPRD